MTLRIEDVRAELLARRRRLLGQVARLESDLRRLDTSAESETEEEGQEENVARLLARLDDRGQAEIARIDVALGRMATGDYGWCARCGAVIPAGRLAALPTVTTCVFCARTEQGRYAAAER